MSGPRTSVLTTIYDRPYRVLRNTLHQLRRNDLTNTEIIVVDDGSTKDYGQIRDYLTQYEMPFKWITINRENYPFEPYSIDGLNNPAFAWNTALDAAQGEIIVCLASDCMIPPNALKHAKTPGRSVWMSGVVDMDTGVEFLGRGRLAPYGWFMSWNREYHDIRWDLEFLRGIDYDDNDFTARLALSSKRIDIDLGITAFHQSHPKTAYSDGHRGHDINERYTWKKWGGVPWAGNEYDPLEIKQARENHLYVLHVERKPQAKAKVTA